MRSLSPEVYGERNRVDRCVLSYRGFLKAMCLIIGGNENAWMD